MKIHPTAIIDPGAELHESVSVGPYAVIEDGAKIGAETVIRAHALISGRTTIGARNDIGSFTCIGTPPQDLKYNNEDTELVIGDGNKIREYVSIHRGTIGDRGVTTIGNDNMLMAYVHVAHDCVLGDRIVLANGVTLGGHVHIESKAIVGGIVAVHQFSRIGAHSYIGGMSGINKDIPPYVIVSGMRKQMRVLGINRVGLKRSGFDDETILKLSRAYKIIFRKPELLLEEALERALAESPDCEPVKALVQFFRDSKRGVIRKGGDEEQ